MAGVITAAEAKKQLNIRAETTTNDEELQDFVDSVTEVVEDVVGPVHPREVVEVRELNYSPVFVLSYAPVIEVLSLVPVQLGGPMIAVSDVDAEPRSGVLRLIDPTARFRGVQRITYRAGRDPVPKNINLGTRIVVAHLWKTQRAQLGARGGYSSEEDLVPTPSGFLIPHRAMTLFQPSARPPVLA